MKPLNSDLCAMKTGYEFLSFSLTTRKRKALRFFLRFLNAWQRLNKNSAEFTNIKYRIKTRAEPAQQFLGNFKIQHTNFYDGGLKARAIKFYPKPVLLLFFVVVRSYFSAFRVADYPLFSSLRERLILVSV